MGSAEIAQYAETKEHYPKVFFIVFCNNVWNMICLPLYGCYFYLSTLFNPCGVATTRQREVYFNSPHSHIVDDDDYDEAYTASRHEHVDVDYHHPHQDATVGIAMAAAGKRSRSLRQYLSFKLQQDGLTWSRLALKAAVSTFFLVVADYLYFRALSLTSAASGIVIFNLSSVVVYLLSLVVLREPFSVLKVFSLFLSFGGVVMITIADRNHHSDDNDGGNGESWIGDVVMAGGACFWALYLVSYKKFVGDPSQETINVQSSMVGALSTLLLWPLLIILHFSRAEPFQLPSGSFQIGIFVATTFAVFLNNYMFTFGTALTTPGFVTIGGMLAIPTSAVFDRLFNGDDFPLLKIFGTLSVLVGFLVVNLDEGWLWRMIKRILCCKREQDPALVKKQEEDDLFGRARASTIVEA